MSIDRGDTDPSEILMGGSYEPSIIAPSDNEDAEEEEDAAGVLDTTYESQDMDESLETANGRGLPPLDRLAASSASDFFALRACSPTTPVRRSTTPVAMRLATPRVSSDDSTAARTSNKRPRTPGPNERVASIASTFAESRARKEEERTRQSAKAAEERTKQEVKRTKQEEIKRAALRDQFEYEEKRARPDAERMEKELDLEIRRKKEEASISLERLAKEHELMRQNALLFAEAIARASQGGSFGTHGDNRPA